MSMAKEGSYLHWACRHGFNGSDGRGQFQKLLPRLFWLDGQAENFFEAVGFKRCAVSQGDQAQTLQPVPTFCGFWRVRQVCFRLDVRKLGKRQLLDRDLLAAARGVSQRAVMANTWQHCSVEDGIQRSPEVIASSWIGAHPPHIVRGRWQLLQAGSLRSVARPCAPAMHFLCEAVSRRPEQVSWFGKTSWRRSEHKGLSPHLLQRFVSKRLQTNQSLEISCAQPHSESDRTRMETESAQGSSLVMQALDSSKSFQLAQRPR